MSQSLAAMYAHLIFSTKNREPYFRDIAIQREMHAFLGGVSNELECASITVGGVEDHVHMMARLGRTIAMSAWIKEVKRASSVWIKTKGSKYKTFEWQGGYAVFSVSESNVEMVSKYILNQAEHHRKMTFQEEIRKFLIKHQLEWDERYIWE